MTVPFDAVGVLAAFLDALGNLTSGTVRAEAQPQ